MSRQRGKGRRAVMRRNALRHWSVVARAGGSDGTLEIALAVSPPPSVHGGMTDTREIEVERLVLREPNGGRVLAVLEMVPVESKGYAVRLSLLDPMGEPVLVTEVDHEGQPMLHVGHPDRGSTSRS